MLFIALFTFSICAKYIKYEKKCCAIRLTAQKIRKIFKFHPKIFYMDL
ncbi:hypothetical protein SAMN05216391_12723 [Lachnospiraceae bacterium KHCPX20]|nr:hypothetical protein SAMN05216391_12723 [Lachnospiraceae bacterium KHCPX20]